MRTALASRTVGCLGTHRTLIEKRVVILGMNIALENLRTGLSVAHRMLSSSLGDAELSRRR